MIEQKLEELHDLRLRQGEIKHQFENLRDEIFTPEIRATLKAIDEDEQLSLAETDERIKELTAEIKRLVLDKGNSIKSEHLHAVYMKGRVSWNTKALDGVAAIYPEVAALKKVGKPSVSIRAI